VKHIIATCYDDEKTLHKKYPQAQQIILQLLSANPDQATRLLNADEESEWSGLSPSPSPSKPDSNLPSTTGGDAGCPALQAQRNNPKTRLRSVHYAINGTKLSSIHSKLLRTHSPFTKIVFNFPHVGGLSTDVNRQVRANQELLVGFFKAAIPLLASSERPVQIERSHGEDVDQDDSDAGNDEGNLSELSFENRETAIITKGQILVALFEGEPYTLWNVRDLARHSGLKVVESFRFPWEAYPGYAHARTVGEITTGKDRSAEGKRKGAWRGEERDARCFVFEVKEGEDINRDGTGTKANDVDVGTRKRKRKGMTSGTDNDSGSD
jgi:25S rRNA (uracil2634-N3)-methyltransferase